MFFFSLESIVGTYGIFHFILSKNISFPVFPESSQTYTFLKRASPPPALLSSRHGRQMRLPAPALKGHHLHLPPQDPRLYGSEALPLVRGAKADRRKHISFLHGVRILEPGRDPDRHSGYQVMRLATELVPTYAAILGEGIKNKVVLAAESRRGFNLLRLFMIVLTCCCCCFYVYLFLHNLHNFPFLQARASSPPSGLSSSTFR